MKLKIHNTLDNDKCEPKDGEREGFAVSDDFPRAHETEEDECGRYHEDSRDIDDGGGEGKWADECKETHDDRGISENGPEHVAERE